MAITNHVLVLRMEQESILNEELREILAVFEVTFFWTHYGIRTVTEPVVCYRTVHKRDIDDEWFISPALKTAGFNGSSTEALGELVYGTPENTSRNQETDRLQLEASEKVRL